MKYLLIMLSLINLACMTKEKNTEVPNDTKIVNSTLMKDTIPSISNSNDSDDTKKIFKGFVGNYVGDEIKLKIDSLGLITMNGLLQLPDDFEKVFFEAISDSVFINLNDSTINLFLQEYSMFDSEKKGRVVVMFPKGHLFKGTFYNEGLLLELYDVEFSNEFQLLKE